MHCFEHTRRTMVIVKQVLVFAVFGLQLVSSGTAAIQQDCSSAFADIVFLLDSSGSVGEENFRKQCDFVANFTTIFDIGPNNVQIGVVTFSTTPIIEFHLNDYHNKAGIVQAIKNIKYAQGGTRTDLALQCVKDKCFTKTAGNRKNATDILIVMTDGQSSMQENTKRAIQSLHQLPIKVIVAGIGGNLDRDELHRIATDSHNVFVADDFSHLDQIKDDLRQTACRIDGGWTVFGAFSDCTKSCGGGTRTRSRTCTNPTPSGGGGPCIGDSMETKDCNNQSCPVVQTTTTHVTTSTLAPMTVARIDGGWTQFGAATTCTKTCGGGTRSRERTCTNPRPSGGGNKCIGKAKISEVCNGQACPVMHPSSTPLKTLLQTSTLRQPTSTAGEKGWSETVEDVHNDDQLHLIVCVIIGSILTMCFLVSLAVRVCYDKHKHKNDVNDVQDWDFKARKHHLSF